MQHERYLTVHETALELGISNDAVRVLLKNKHLAGVQVHGIEGGWRILDPSVTLRKQLKEPRLHDFSVITRAELAEITGLSKEALKQHTYEGNLPHTSGERELSLYTVRQVRDFLAYYQRRRGRAKFSHSSIIVDWLRRYLDELKPNGEIIDRLIREAAILPEPERSQMVFKLWTLFDQVNDLLKECQKK